MAGGAGVEEIGRRAAASVWAWRVVWARSWVPWPPPSPVGGWAMGSVRPVRGSRPSRLSRGWVARWWFENWIVDASGHGPGARGCCMILSRHASPVLWGVCVDRLVTDHFCCVLVWSSWCLQLAFSGGRAVAGEGVWWMPWQTVPMKDVVGRDRPRGAAERALIRGFPNGVTRRP